VVEVLIDCLSCSFFRLRSFQRFNKSIFLKTQLAGLVFSLRKFGGFFFLGFFFSRSKLFLHLFNVGIRQIGFGRHYNSVLFQFEF
jgi:hypothetical protein